MLVALQLGAQVPQPVALRLRRLRALLQRRHLPRRGARFVYAVERLFLDGLELLRHLGVAPRRHLALALALVASLVEHALHLAKRPRAPGEARGSTRREPVGTRVRYVRERLAAGERGLRGAEARVQLDEPRAEPRVFALLERERVLRRPQRRRDGAGVLAPLPVLRRHLRPERLELRPEGLALGAGALELGADVAGGTGVGGESGDVVSQRLRLALVRVARLGEELVVILGHASVLRQRLRELLLKARVPRG